MTEQQMAEVIYRQMTNDLFLNDHGKLRHRFIANRAAREIATINARNAHPTHRAVRVEVRQDAPRKEEPRDRS